MTKFLNQITTYRLILLILIIISSIISIITLLWVFYTHPSEIVEGEGLVDTQITIITTPTTFSMKPITLLVISLFILWMSGLEFLHNFLLKLPKIFKLLMIFFLATILMIYAYETIWNFFIWDTVYELNQGKINIDILTPQLNQMNPTRVNPTFRPYNLVYVTKRDTFYVACSLYGIFFFYRLMNANIHKISEK